MTITDIDVGTVANDGTGDPIRTGGETINSNFTQVVAELATKLTEAPSDSQQYARENGSWQVVVDTIGVEEAPNDGLQYARQDSAWEEVATGAGDITEVTASYGLFGGGTSGAVGLAVGGSSTINVLTSSVEVANTSIDDTKLAADAVVESKMSGLGVGNFNEFAKSDDDGGFVWGKVNEVVDEISPSISQGTLSYSGSTIDYISGESHTGGDVVYIKAFSGTPRSYKAIADSGTTTPAMAININDSSTIVGISNKYLTRGVVKSTSFTFSTTLIGKPIYLSTATSGAITTTLPTTSGDYVQILGYVIAADTIFFDPNYMLIEIS